MYDLLNILYLSLAVLCIFSLLVNYHKTASMIIILWSLVIFSMRDNLYFISANGSLAGVVILFIISLVISLMFLSFYKIENRKILLKLSTVFSALSAINILCMMTYIEVIRNLWWYHSATFDFFYWHYGELQIILTLYMISLFWKSGIMGLSNGFTKIFGHNPSRQRINSVGYIGDLPNSYPRIDNILLDRRLKKQSQKNNKGIQS